MSEEPMEFSVYLPEPIAALVDQWVAEGAPPEVLTARLVEREEQVADVLRLAGQSYGVLPQIMAEVFAQIRLGTPISTEQRALIHSQYHRVIDAIHRGEDPFNLPMSDDN